jgi:hypothetical protein
VERVMDKSILVRDKDGKLWQPSEENFNTQGCWKDSEIIARGDYYDLCKIKVLVNEQLKLERELTNVM